ncbi:hypothetical protein [Nonomuraea polychroma]|uniref:hypothetical protein n=1 Tax=Nonomuraea polychroma TaxID=46176 RepID=UPI0019D483E6|nr:hypothetical protein [Nonomuraea polychroma]
MLAILNMAWPRTPDAPWYDNYLVALSGLVVAAGLVYLLVARPAVRQGRRPSGDAVPQEAA